ncbi:MAG: quinohemoprotein amine dehydrogenase maturation protein [Azonexus sp.]|jgi:uncharacterized protein|nr:quinohemoprotein amine dehydrogenase maturation protein [Azonexus sp.]
MGAMLKLVERNLHEVQVGGNRLLFHIPSSSLFASDELTGNVIDALRQRDCSPAELTRHLGSRFAADDIGETLRELMALEVIHDGSPLTPEIGLQRVAQTALDTVVLNVNTGCNLACTYCYKEDLTAPSAGKRMSAATAEASVEMLFAESPAAPRYNIVFFGGEPLSNRPLIEHMVDWCERRARELGKPVNFAMTTNATLLNEDLVDWLDAHRFGLAISIDGPQAVHDKNRLTIGGQGTYEVVRKKVDMLLARYKSRPIGARVTLTRGTTGIEAIWNHLVNDIGFAEAGFAPVTSGNVSAFNLTPEETATVFANMKALGQKYLAAALENRNIGFSNLHQLLGDLHEGNKKALPCGAGLKMLAVDHQGELNLCHRFTGSAVPTFGNVHHGVNKAALHDFLSQRLNRADTGCAACRIRNLCSGGCYHESYARYGDPAHPTYHYCELMRDWVDFGIAVYSRIMAENPGFIDQYITPRKGN